MPSGKAPPDRDAPVLMGPGQAAGASFRDDSPMMVDRSIRRSDLNQRHL